MQPNDSIIAALGEGAPDSLPKAGEFDSECLGDEEIVLALSRAAERIVGHRMQYHEVVHRAVELGVPCDIWTAARAGLLDQVQQLLAENPELLEATSRGRTALQRATLVYGVCAPCEEVADFLIGEGAKIDVFTAATFCMPEAVRARIEENPRVVEERAEGTAPLGWAVRPRRNYAEAAGICRDLLEAGAIPNDHDSYESNMTPLHHAAEWGHPVCIRIADLLIEAGADPDARDNNGWTALDYAKDRKRKPMVAHLSKL